MVDRGKLETFISEVGREVGLRTNLYPRWVSQGKMTPEEASRRKQTMTDLYEFLKGLREEPDYEGILESAVKMIHSVYHQEEDDEEPEESWMRCPKDVCSTVKRKVLGTDVQPQGVA